MAIQMYQAHVLLRCFSATASFIRAALLVPAGVYCVKKAARLPKPYWVIAVLPLLFGVQQVFEGGMVHWGQACMVHWGLPSDFTR